MEKVICIDDSNLPLGAEIIKGGEYIIVKEYLNSLDQRVYIIGGVRNKGTTKLGMLWEGYDARRFSIKKSTKKHTLENDFLFNLN